ncbi:hypothetical protein [Bacteroides xylanisolvens]|nr:hypothetical protein [Bacteroides xylanisolvens]MDE5406138.1 hypothetical protein [Bacteroides xylanisolvens]
MKTRCCCSKRYLLVFSILLVSVGSIFMSVSFFLFLSFSEESIVIMR